MIRVAEVVGVVMSLGVGACVTVAYVLLFGWRAIGRLREVMTGT